MGGEYNVFISWSGERSRLAAEALRWWLPVVLQASKPWMSEEDIEKGSRGLEEVGRALDGMRIGIVCLTPENLNAQWILYEVGALAKTLGEKARVCTFLLGGLKPPEIRPPLGMFQATRSDDKKDTGKLINDVNRALGPPSVPEDALETSFGAVWHLLEEKLLAIPAVPEVARPTRGVPEMVEELLELSRAGASSRKAVERLDKYIPVIEKFMPVLETVVQAAESQPRFVVPGSSLVSPELAQTWLSRALPAGERGALSVGMMEKAFQAAKDATAEEEKRQKDQGK